MRVSRWSAGNWRCTNSNLWGCSQRWRQKMVVRERVMRVTSKHSSSRRGFFLIPVLVRLVGKSVERVEPHDLWIRTALHRSTYRHCHRAPPPKTLDYFPLLPDSSNSQLFPLHDNTANDATGCPVQASSIIRHLTNNSRTRTHREYRSF